MAETSKVRIDATKKRLFEEIEAIRNSLISLSEMGCQGFDCSPKTIDTVTQWGSNKPGFQETLASIREDLGDCRRCKLSETRKNIVFGIGAPNARLVFVGEGPGYDEDQKGEPFVGAAGQLLNKIIHAINLTREQVYICNVIKCRPPGNRNPMPDEITTCYPFLIRQISAIQPDVICALGAFAAQTLLEEKQQISKLRGRFHHYRGIKVLPTYHPAFLLRNPDKKRDVWGDMKKLMTALGNRS